MYIYRFSHQCPHCNSVALAVECNPSFENLSCKPQNIKVPSNRLLESNLGAECPYLVKVGPEGADRQFNLSPGMKSRSWGVPHRKSHGAVVLFDIDVELSRSRTLTAGSIILKCEAMGIIFLQLGNDQLSLLSWKSPRCVHHHEGWTCTEARLYFCKQNFYSKNNCLLKHTTILQNVFI